MTLGVQNKHKGALAELIASEWLLRQGYDVFRNLSAHGIVDLIAIDFTTGEQILVDVKSGKLQRNGTLLCAGLTEDQSAKGIRSILVDEENNTCQWRVEKQTLQTKSCKRCEKEFTPIQHNQIFCTVDCRRYGERYKRLVLKSQIRTECRELI